MIALTVIVCYVADPTRCEPKTFHGYATSEVGCMFTAQATIAQWMQARNGVTVSEWRCEAAQ